MCKCQPQFVGVAKMFSVKDVDDTASWVELVELLVVLQTSEKLPIVQALSNEPEAFAERLSMDLLLRLSEVYGITLKQSILQSRLSSPNEVLIKYLRSSGEGRKLLKDQLLVNWQLYKADLFATFKEHFEELAPIPVKEFNFRGDLINDKPFIVEHVGRGEEAT